VKSAAGHRAILNQHGTDAGFGLTRPRPARPAQRFFEMWVHSSKSEPTEKRRDQRQKIVELLADAT